jgi:hypothetical protein
MLSEKGHRNLCRFTCRISSNSGILPQIDPRTSKEEERGVKKSQLKRLKSGPSASPRAGGQDDFCRDINISTYSAKDHVKTPTRIPEPALVANSEKSEISERLNSIKGKSKNRPTSSHSRFKPKKESNQNKELDWFAFENRMREIVKDILEPYAVRSIDIQESLKFLSDNHDKFKRKQDEMEFIMHKRNHRNSGIDELNKKLFDIENERKVREAKNMQMIEGLKSQLESTQDRMGQIEELSLTFKKQADDIKHEINGFFDQLTRFQEKFSKDQLKYKEEMNRNFLTLRNQYLKTEELSKVNKNYITNHFDELKRHDMIVQSYQKNFNELYKKIQMLDRTKIDVTQFNDETTKIKKDINHVRLLNEDVFQSVQLIDNYIEEFIPLNIEKQLKV